MKWKFRIKVYNPMIIDMEGYEIFITGKTKRRLGFNKKRTYKYSKIVADHFHYFKIHGE